jgi:hypothetical protein
VLELFDEPLGRLLNEGLLGELLIDNRIDR